MQSPPHPADGWIRSLAESAGGFVLGAAVTVVALRTRLAMIDTRLAAHDQRFIDMQNDHTVELTRLRAENDQRHRENQQRQDEDRARQAEDRDMQRFTLKLVSDVARAIGVDHRVDDQVVAFFLTKPKE